MVRNTEIYYQKGADGGRCSICAKAPEGALVLGDIRIPVCDDCRANIHTVTDPEYRANFYQQRRKEPATPRAYARSVFERHLLEDENDFPAPDPNGISPRRRAIGYSGQVRPRISEAPVLPPGRQPLLPPGSKGE